MKKCYKCDEKKLLTEFYRNKNKKDGYASECKACDNARKRTKEAKEKKKEYDKQYFQNNRELRMEQQDRWIENNPEAWKEIQRRSWKKQYKKRSSSVEYRLQAVVRSAVHKMLKGERKSSRTFDALPYTPQQLREHLERQFADWMTWENYGSRWDIDHIYPQSKLPYDNLDHPNFIRCWSLDNLQPLEKIANIQKSNRIL